MSKFIPPRNYCSFSGNLVSDPTYKESNTTSIPITRFSLAVSNYYVNKEGEKVNKPLFVPVIAFGNLARDISDNFRGGDPISVSGRLQNESLEDGSTFISLIITRIN